MLPDILVSKYLEYKRDTDSIASWLASTAKAAGFNSSDLSAPPSLAGTNGGRLRGKGRKQAEKDRSKRVVTSTNYVIRIRDFTTLAEYILEKAIAVPLSFQSTLDRAIAARAGFGARLEARGFSVDPDVDAKHANFVDVLRHVRVILTSLMPSPDEDKSFDRGDALPNRFAGLAVDEPSEAFLSAPDIQRPTKPAADPVDYTAEPPTSFVDAIFALWMLIDDMNQARASIRGVWELVKDAGFDLVPAAVTTNTVIELVRNMIEDVLPLVEMHGGLEICLERCYLLRCVHKKFSQSELTPENAKDSSKYDINDISDINDTYDEANETFFMSFSLLKTFQDVIKMKLPPLDHRCSFGTFDANSDRTKKLGEDKFKDDGALLTPVLTDLMTIVLMVPAWPVHDELLRGMKEYMENGQIPFSMVFAAQVFLDVTYTLGPDIERVFQSFRRHTDFIMNDLKLCFDYHEKLKTRSRSPSIDLELRPLHEHMLWLSKDPVFQVEKYVLELQGIQAKKEGLHRIFRMSPVLCGLILYQARFRYREYGMAVADAWGSIQNAGHLYNALQNTGLLVDRWEDMEFVKVILGTESFYPGGQEPRTVRDALKKYCLQVGISAVAFSEGGRKGRTLVSKTGPRGLRVTAPVATMFKERYADNRDVVLTSEEVNRIIQLSRFELELGGEMGHPVLSRIGDEKKLKEKEKLRHDIENGLKPSSRESTSGTRISLGLLTGKLATTLQAEMQEFSFPYMKMHRWCWRLFRAVRDECDSQPRQIDRQDYFDHESELSFLMTGYIFILASGAGGRAPTMGPMVAAAEALNRMLRAGTGSIIRDTLKDALSMPVWLVEESDEESYEESDEESDEEEENPE